MTFQTQPVNSTGCEKPTLVRRSTRRRRFWSKRFKKKAVENSITQAQNRDINILAYFRLSPPGLALGFRSCSHLKLKTPQIDTDSNCSFEIDRICEIRVPAYAPPINSVVFIKYYSCYRSFSYDVSLEQWRDFPGLTIKIRSDHNRPIISAAGQNFEFLHFFLNRNDNSFNHCSYRFVIKSVVTFQLFNSFDVVIPCF